MKGPGRHCQRRLSSIWCASGTPRKLGIFKVLHVLRFSGDTGLARVPLGTDGLISVEKFNPHDSRSGLLALVRGSEALFLTSTDVASLSRFSLGASRPSTGVALCRGGIKAVCLGGAFLNVHERFLRCRPSH